jgi:hypothetical protein
MPYMVQGKCVHKKNADGSAGAMVKCHESPEKAKAHMRALMANVDDAKMFMMLSQKETVYTTLSALEGHACANCRWFKHHDEYAPCHLVEPHPEPILVTGWCDRWEEKVEHKPEPVPVVIVGDESKADEQQTTAPLESQTQAPATSMETAKEQQPQSADVVSRFAAWIKSTLLPTGETKELAYGFKTHPTLPIWIAWYSTATKDLDEEYFPRAATDEFIDVVQKGLEPYPEVWMFHAALPIGKAQVIGRQDLITYSAGHYDDTSRAKAFMNWSRKQPQPLPVSHGFKYTKSLKRNSAYWRYRTFEISPLHPVYQKAANPIAQFSEVYDMTLKPEQIKALADVAGSDELATQWATEALAAMERKSKELESQGVEFKETGEAPVIPVVDADARKEVEALKTAQASLEKTLTDTLTKVIQEQGETVAKALKAELDKRDATIKALTDKIEAIETARKEEQELYAPASQSLITQIMSGSMAAKEADELKKKNAEPENKTVVDRWLTGQVATSS